LRKRSHIRLRPSNLKNGGLPAGGKLHPVPEQKSPVVKEVVTMVEGEKLARADQLKRLQDYRTKMEKLQRFMGPNKG